MNYLFDRRHQMAKFLDYDAENALLKATCATDSIADQMMTQTNLSPIRDGGIQHYVEPQPMLVAAIGAAMDDRFPLGTLDESPDAGVPPALNTCAQVGEGIGSAIVNSAASHRSEALGVLSRDTFMFVPV